MSNNDEAGLKTQTLLPEEIEKLLQNNFGGKVQPVDFEKLEKQRRKKAGLTAYKKNFRKT